MADEFFISDLHFGHEKLVTLRGFSSVDEMNEIIIGRWNSVVGPKDKVRVLGDVAMSKRYLPLVQELKGDKSLDALGNHDVFDTQLYLNVGFRKVTGCRELDEYLVTHLPTHLSSVWPRFKGNIHGHIHDRGDVPGPYMNVSAEVLNYRPMPFEEVRRKLHAWLEYCNRTNRFVGYRPPLHRRNEE